MKRKFAFVIATVCTLIIAGCGNGGNTNSGNNGTATNAPKESAATEATKAPAKDVTIKMFQFKVEIAEQLNTLAELYEKETESRLKSKRMAAAKITALCSKRKLPQARNRKFSITAATPLWFLTWTALPTCQTSLGPQN